MLVNFFSDLCTILLTQHTMGIVLPGIIHMVDLDLKLGVSS